MSSPPSSPLPDVMSLTGTPGAATQNTSSRASAGMTTPAQAIPVLVPIPVPVAVQAPTPASPARKSKAKETAPKPKKQPKVTETFDPDGPIWDDCNEVRRKIRAHLRSGVKVTHFLRELGVNSNSYGRFMSYKHADQGMDNGLYSAAYYFFEEKRINEGKPKGKKRKDNEARGGIRVRYY